VAKNSDCQVGVLQMRIHAGQGWRLYYAQEGHNIYLLLDGGTKATQPRDIQRAIALWQRIKQEADT